jgi:hypothetical protein
MVLHIIAWYGYVWTIESASNEDQLLIDEHSENEVDDKLIIRCSCTLEKDNPKMHDTFPLSRASSSRIQNT